ncbi:MAG: hypothetical protein JRG82_08895 [Deltaproteobacteria bacterium]|nr:hypothetical protein [Deltaproteobacteria bacterium]
MQKLFGLLVIIGMVWYALSVYTGDGRGGVDMGGWLDPIGGADDGPQMSMPGRSPSSDDSSSGSSSRSNHWNSSSRAQKTGRESITKSESIPQAMKRKVTNAFQKSYDRVDP